MYDLHTGVYSFHRLNQLYICYHVKASGNIQLDTTELADYKLVPLSQLRSWPQGTGLAVRDFIKTERDGKKNIKSNL